MILGGLWHGAALNFIIWGLLHGLFLSTHRFFSNKINFKINLFKNTPGKIISILITQYFIFLSWIAFRVRDPDYLLYSLQKYILLDFQVNQTIDFINSHKFPFFVLCSFILFFIVTARKDNLISKVSELPFPLWGLFLFSISSLILFFYNGNNENFIYFQF